MPSYQSSGARQSPLRSAGRAARTTAIHAASIGTNCLVMSTLTSRVYRSGVAVPLLRAEAGRRQCRLVGAVPQDADGSVVNISSMSGRNRATASGLRPACSRPGPPPQREHPKRCRPPTPGEAGHEPWHRPARVRATPPRPESDQRHRRPLSFQTQCLVGPRKIVRAHRTELSIEVVQQSLKTVLALSTSNRRTDEARDRCRPAPLNSMTNRVNLCVRETHRYLPSHTRIMLEERPG